ncbi:hypothetical protein HHI36_012811 [Cryptolaemus montrouzieri]|uniref:Uncharacterized protein n=1 Tax=Cryptolaemus montrouzieri TaxID=559131 RepID=A0ABD2NFZ4_9CUCU
MKLTHLQRAENGESEDDTLMKERLFRLKRGMQGDRPNKTPTNEAENTNVVTAEAGTHTCAEGTIDNVSVDLTREEWGQLVKMPREGSVFKRTSSRKERLVKVEWDSIKLIFTNGMAAAEVNEKYPAIAEIEGNYGLIRIRRKTRIDVEWHSQKSRWVRGELPTSLEDIYDHLLKVKEDITELPERLQSPTF